MRAQLAGCLLSVTTLSIAAQCAAGEVALSVRNLEAPSFSVRSVRAVLAGSDLRELAVDVGELAVAGRTWKNVRLTCPQIEQTRDDIGCARGVLQAGEKIPVSFSYAASGDFVVEVKRSADETWRLSGSAASGRRALNVTLANARLDALTPWLPADVPRITAGRATGSGFFSDRGLKAKLDLTGAAFADPSGLHAGEKVSATIEFDGARDKASWRWKAAVIWQGGDVFWQPLFVSGKGQRVEAQGTTSGGVTRVTAGRLDLREIGSLSFTGEWEHAKSLLRALEVRGSGLRVAPLYEQILNPALQQPTVSDMRAEGLVNVSASAAAGALTSADVELIGVSFEDRQRRFGVFGANGRVPWHRDHDTNGEVTFKGAEILKVPIGEVRLPLRLRGMRVAIDAARIPLLDGALLLKGFAAARTSNEWRWRFSGELAPVSMERLTQTLGVPTMHGSFSGVIPEVRYRRKTVSVDGTLVTRAFDGVISASRLELIDAFGRAPRLHGEVEMKNLDLELLTRTFDFGTITGRVDVRIAGLELVDWQPVRFDAHIASSAGTYPRRISQRAVQNISALGGAGAAAAIQRSFLRFFEQFGYEKLGLSCRLENGVCQMDGIDRAPQGYVIVKGGGIPAISVIGYNRAVNWRELVERLKRITQENVKPVVK